MTSRPATARAGHIAPELPERDGAGGWRRAAATRGAARVPVALVVLALPLVRPNIFGEYLSLAGFGLLALAATLTVVLPAPSRGGPLPRWSGRSPAMVLVVCLGLAYLWLLVEGAATDPAVLGRTAAQGIVLTVGAVLAVVVICADPRTRLALGRAFVFVLVALSVSYVLTAVLWAVAGIGTGAVTSIPIGGTGELSPVYFPFTPTFGVQGLFGQQIPRFTGLGREPGWMAMYCAVAFFLTDMVGWRSRWVKAVLLAGLIGCISTAGFGVFVVAWTYHVFLRSRGHGISLGGYLRQVLGLAALAGAVWVAIAAPVLGLGAKATENAVSLAQRQAATEAGLSALSAQPQGGGPLPVQAGVNLISDIALDGLPFVLLVSAALLLPLVLHRGPPRFGSAVALTVFLTLLLAQPPRDSTWAFAVVALAICLDAPDMEPLVPTSQHRRSGAGLHRRSHERP